MASLKRIQEAVAGWGGSFIADDGTLLYQHFDCQAGTCDCSEGECGLVIGELDDHVAESLAVLLNAPRELARVVEAAKAWADFAPDCNDPNDPTAHQLVQALRALDATGEGET